MNDLFSIDDLSGGDEKFLLDWKALRQPLEDDMKITAINRCQEACYNLRDPDRSSQTLTEQPFLGTGSSISSSDLG